MTYISHIDEAKHKTRDLSRHFRGINTFLNLYIFYSLNNLDLLNFLSLDSVSSALKLLVLQRHHHHHATQKLTNTAKYDELSDFQGRCLFVKFDPSKYTCFHGSAGGPVKGRPAPSPLLG